MREIKMYLKLRKRINLYYTLKKTESSTQGLKYIFTC